MLKKMPLTLFLVSLYTASAQAAEVVNAKGGFLDFNLYPYLSDVSTDSTFSLNMATNLPNRISYFGFINLYNQGNRSELSDVNTFYTEQNLRWQIRENSAFDATFQYVAKSGDNNDKERIGIRWRMNDSAFLKEIFAALHLKWSINFHALQFDHDPKTAWQIEHAFSMTFPYFSDRLYLAGFIDHNINETVAAKVPSNPVVAEAQLGYRLVDNLYVISEYRINEYRQSDINNLAVGIEYKMKW